jgi:hypothetical protein
MVLLVIQIHPSLHLIEGRAEHSLDHHDGKAAYIANHCDWPRGRTMQTDTLQLHDRCLIGKQAALSLYSSLIILPPPPALAEEMQAFNPSVPRLHSGKYRKRQR